MRHRGYRRQYYRHHHFPAVTLLFITVVFAAYGFVSYRLPLPALAAVSTLPTEPTTMTTNLPWPVQGQAAIGAVGYGVLAVHGSDAAIPTASIAKMMTALAVLKKYPLQLGQQGPTITLTKTDVDYFDTYFAEDGSLVKVAAGEKITEYQALEAMILPSANNMAESLAVWAYGSMDAYTTFVNNYAPTLGLKNAHFADASGFSPQTVASASDLVQLGIASLQNPVLAHIVDEKQASVPIAGVIPNVNWLLGNHGINGIKTGSTDQDGGVYLFSAPHTYPNGQTITLVGAIMGMKLLTQAFNASIPLLAQAQADFSPTAVLTAGQIVGHYTVPWDVDIDAVATKSLTLMAWQGRSVTPQITFRSLQAPFAKGTTVGTITTMLDPDQTITVVTKQAATTPHWYWRALRRL